MSFPIARDKCKELRSELETALAAIGAKLGMSIQLAGSMSYNETTISVKITANLPNRAGNVEPLEAKDFKANAWRWGLVESDLGRTFTSRGQTYTITGAKPRSSQYPILGQRKDGKTFKFPADQIKWQLHPAA
jgi:hypothetical protein